MNKLKLKTKLLLSQGSNKKLTILIGLIQLSCNYFMKLSSTFVSFDTVPRYCKYAVK